VSSELTVNSSYEREKENHVTFWSSQTLEANLAQLIPSGGAPIVDCNAITMTVGKNYYVTPRWSDGDSGTRTVHLLDQGEAIAIPPGQFGFLETAETIKLDGRVMGFISFKATYKMKGLVNVSGFHVDPGWEGPLKFALYNAGPNPIHIQQGMPLFLLWIANLDEPSKMQRTKASSDDDFVRMVNGVSGSVNSGYDLSDRITTLELKQAATNEQIAWIKGIGLALAVGVSLMFVRFLLDESSTKPPATGSSHAESTVEALPSQAQQSDGADEPIPVQPEK